MPPAEAPMATTIGWSLAIGAESPFEDAFDFDGDFAFNELLSRVFRFAMLICCFGWQCQFGRSPRCSVRHARMSGPSRTDVAANCSLSDDDEQQTSDAESKAGRALEMLWRVYAAKLPHREPSFGDEPQQLADESG